MLFLLDFSSPNVLSIGQVKYRDESAVSSIYLTKCDNVQLRSNNRLVMSRPDSDERKLIWSERCTLRACNEQHLCSENSVLFQYKDTRTPIFYFSPKEIIISNLKQKLSPIGVYTYNNKPLSDLSNMRTRSETKIKIDENFRPRLLSPEKSDFPIKFQIQTRGGFKDFKIHHIESLANQTIKKWCQSLDTKLTVDTAKTDITITTFNIRSNLKVFLTNFRYMTSGLPAPEFLEAVQDNTQVKLIRNQVGIRNGNYLADLICYKRNQGYNTTIAIRARSTELIRRSFMLSRNPIVININESTITGTVVGTIAPRNSCPHYFTVYKLQSSLVSIDSFGVVVLESNLDFETVKQHEVSIQLSCGTIQSNTTLLINVLDVNDESPVFTQQSGTVFKVIENYTGSFGFVRATDPDSTFIYVIEDNPFFAINPHTGMLSTKQKLNYELDKYHGIQVVARDSAGHEGKVDIIIQVIDSDEYQPVIKYETEIGVDLLELPVSKDLVLGQVTVNDFDGVDAFNFFINKVEPGYLAYLIKIGQKSGVLYVGCDSRSTFVGDLKVNVAIMSKDRKVTKMDIFIPVLQRGQKQVIIMDKCTISQCDLSERPIQTCLIVNENYLQVLSSTLGRIDRDGYLMLSTTQPKLYNVDLYTRKKFVKQIEVNVIKCDLYRTFKVKNSHFEILSTTEIGRKIGSISMEERGDFFYRIKFESLFYIDNSGNVILTGSLKPNEQKYYSIPAEVLDYSIPPKKLDFTLSVMINPVLPQESLIEFDKKVYNAYPNSTLIAQCRVLNKYARISPIIVTKPAWLASKFAITDDCRLLKVSNFSTPCKVTITARNKLSTIIQPVTIKINTIDSIKTVDNRNECTSKQQITINENARASFKVSYVQLGDNVTVVQSVPSGYVKNFRFNSNRLNVVKPFDYEEINQLKLLLLVERQLTNCTLVITIKIVNLNDNPPKFTKSIVAEIRPDFDFTNPVAVIQASDDDSDEIVFNNDTNVPFEIRRNEIYLQKETDISLTNSYLFDVSASDSRYKVTTTANITLLGSTNQIPEFNRAKLNLYAWSGTNKTDVGCVRAEYAYQLSYLIVTPKKYISIDQKVNLSLVSRGSQSCF